MNVKLKLVFTCGNYYESVRSKSFDLVSGDEISVRIPVEDIIHDLISDNCHD